MDIIPVRREVIYRGQVQGVGFRYHTAQIAGDYAVTGYVQNMDDGRVALIVEGKPADLDAFLADLETDMAQYVRGKQDQTVAARGEFTEFRIRRP